nr:hypothetical protein [Bacillus coahuilensis]
MVGPFLGMIGVLLGFFGTSIVLIFSAIIVPFAEPVFSTLNLNLEWITYSTAFPWIGTVFVSMICLGFGILFSIVTWFLSKGLFYISRKYIVWNIEVISPNRKEEK